MARPPFVVSLTTPNLRSSRRGRRPIYPFHELVQTGMALTIPPGMEERARDAAQKWAKRYGWTFEYLRDERDRLVIVRRG